MRIENNATLYRTRKHCRPQNRLKRGEKATKNMILALFRLFFVAFKMIENWGSVGGRRVLKMRTPPPQKYHLIRKVFCEDGAWLAVPYVLLLPFL